MNGPDLFPKGGDMTEMERAKKKREAELLARDVKVAEFHEWLKNRKPKEVASPLSVSSEDVHLETAPAPIKFFKSKVLRPNDIDQRLASAGPESRELGPDGHYLENQ